MISTVTRSNLIGVKTSVAGLANSKATGGSYMNPKTFLTTTTLRSDNHTDKILERARTRNQKIDHKVKMYATGPPCTVKREVKVERFSKEALLETARVMNLGKGNDPDFGLEEFLPLPKPIKKYWASQLTERETGFQQVKGLSKTVKTPAFERVVSAKELPDRFCTTSQLATRSRLRELEATELTDQDKAGIIRKASQASLPAKTKTAKEFQYALDNTAQRLKKLNLYGDKYMKDRVLLTARSPKHKL